MSFNHSNKKSESNTNNQYLIGRKSVIDGLLNKLPITQIYLDKQDSEIKMLANQNKIPITIHSDKWFNTQFNKHLNHQGTVASVNVQSLFTTPDKLLEHVRDKQESLILVLDQIMDPGNFGAILRSACAANVDGVIFKNDNQCPVNTTVIKTSMGAVFYLNLVPVSNLRYVIKKFQDVGFWSVASCLADDSQNYKDINVDKMMLIVGNEDRGISPLLIKEADYRVKIPINNKIESLNASVASALLMFEYRKK